MGRIFQTLNAQGLYQALGASSNILTAWNLQINKFRLLLTEEVKNSFSTLSKDNCDHPIIINNSLCDERHTSRKKERKKAREGEDTTSCTVSFLMARGKLLHDYTKVRHSHRTASMQPGGVTWSETRILRARWCVCVWRSEWAVLFTESG